MDERQFEVIYQYLMSLTSNLDRIATALETPINELRQELQSQHATIQTLQNVRR